MTRLYLNEGRPGRENTSDALPVTTQLHMWSNWKVMNQTGQIPSEASQLSSHTPFSVSHLPQSLARERTGLWGSEEAKLH